MYPDFTILDENRRNNVILEHLGIFVRIIVIIVRKIVGIAAKGGKSSNAVLFWETGVCGGFAMNYVS